jgi:hypothetical protein
VLCKPHYLDVLEGGSHKGKYLDIVVTIKILKFRSRRRPEINATYLCGKTLVYSVKVEETHLEYIYLRKRRCIPKMSEIKSNTVHNRFMKM